MLCCAHTFVFKGGNFQFFVQTNTKFEAAEEHLEKHPASVEF